MEEKTKEELVELNKTQELVIESLTKMVVSLQEQREDLVNESYNMYNEIQQIKRCSNQEYKLPVINNSNILVDDELIKKSFSILSDDIKIIKKCNTINFI